MMKRLSPLLKLFLSFAFLLFCGSSCEKGSLEGVRNDELNTVVQLDLNEKSLVNKEFVIEVIKINDSRCPADVQCIWAGNASVQFKTSSLNQADQLIDLCIGKCDLSFKTTDKINFTINSNNYTLLLKDVTPYPKKEGSKEKKIVFTISRN